MIQEIPLVSWFLVGNLSIHVSMSRLESRPLRTGLWQYVFFIDLEGHEQDANVTTALDEIRQKAAFLKIFGSYPVS